jgi:uridine kinase
MMQTRQVIKRDGSVVPYDIQRIATAIYKAAASLGGKDQELSARLAHEVEERLWDSTPQGSSASVEEIQDLVERVLVLRGHVQTAKAYILYRHRREQVRRGEIGQRIRGQVETVPWKLLWRTLAWNAAHDCETTGGLGRWVERGELSQLIRQADAEYEKQLEWAAEEILDQRDRVRVVIVAGPSSSGKTTTTHKIASRLQAQGLELVAMNLDNYFRDLVLHPRDEFGDYDYETPEALDLALINRHLRQLLDGEAIRMPVYDFHTGKQALDQIPLALNPNQVILIDTLHGLSDDLTRTVPAEAKFKVYIETFSQLRMANQEFVRWTDVRLLRRMVRDASFRNHDPALTLGHWHYVRRAELKHIIPYLHTVDLTINGSVPYELAVLKRRVQPYLQSVVDGYRDQPARGDAFIRGQRVAAMLEEIPVASEEDETAIASDGLMREFIGGSTIRY